MKPTVLVLYDTILRLYFVYGSKWVPGGKRFFLKLAYDIHHVESCGNPHGLSESDDFMHVNDFFY